jgi:hypothetical protein
MMTLTTNIVSCPARQILRQGLFQEGPAVRVVETVRWRVIRFGQEAIAQQPTSRTFAELAGNLLDVGK